MIYRLKNSIFLAIFLAMIFVLVGLQGKAAEPGQKSKNFKTRTKLIQAPKAKKRLNLRWRYSVGLDSFSELTDESKSGAGKFEVQGNYALTSIFSVKGSAQLQAALGRVQDRFDSGQFNSIIVKESVGHLRLANVMYGELGIINQSYLENQLLQPSHAFPGARGGFEFVQKGPWKLGLHFQQTVPTSTSLNTERVEKEELPFFINETIKLEYNKKKLANLLLSAAAKINKGH